MAIKIIYGPGGSGKSLWQMFIVVTQLRETRRNICTNLAIDIPKLQVWLEKTYPDEVLDAVRRIRILTTEETREFWKHRGPLRWKSVPGDEYACEYDPGHNGVCYIIDEAGAAGFGALGWAAQEGRTSRGEACSWYLDQQRKFGDDVFASANGRTPAAIAKPFRDKAHGFVKLRNEYLATYGPFKGRGRFKWRLYETEPNGQKIEHIQEGTFCFGSGLEDCYRTQDGVGVFGQAADKGARAKGIPIMWVIPGGLALASLCFLIPWGLGRLGNSVIEKTARNRGIATAGVAPGSPQAPGAPMVPTAPRPGARHLATRAGATVVSYSVVSGVMRVEMSDGTIYDQTSPELGGVARDAVMIDGEWLQYRAPKIEPAASPVTDEVEVVTAKDLEPVSPTPALPPGPPPAT